MTPHVLVVGHIVKDITTAGWRLGGGAYYAAAQFSRLGLNVGVVTACGADVSPPELPRVEWRTVRSLETTTFENVYKGDRREQRLTAVGGTLGLDHIPAEWREAPIVLLAPVFHDVDAALPSRLAASGTLVALAGQGWLRRLEGESVRPGDVEVEPAWLEGQIVFVSDEDVTAPDVVGEWQAKVRLVVLTRGREGYSLWNHDGVQRFAGPVVAEVDATGAGDIFAAAFVYAYATGSDDVDAARFAHTAASLAVRAEGVDGVAGRTEIEAEMRREATVGAG